MGFDPCVIQVNEFPHLVCFSAWDVKSLPNSWLPFPQVIEEGVAIRGVAWCGRWVQQIAVTLQESGMW